MIEVLFLLAVVILLAASALLIANTIRLSIFSRRREIEVMKLVGATNWFVRGPFMLEGLLVGLVGSVAAVILLLLGKEIALPAILGHIDDGDEVQALSFGLNALIVIGVGPAAGRRGLRPHDPPLPQSLTRAVVEIASARQVRRRRAVLHARDGDPARPSGAQRRAARRPRRRLAPAPRAGAPRARARAGGPIEAVLEGLLVERGALVEFEPYDTPQPTPGGSGRPARLAGVHDRPGDGEGLRRRDLGAGRGGGAARVGAHRRRLALRPGRLAARPRSVAARLLDVRAGPRRADAAARARRRPVLAEAEHRSALRHGRGPFRPDFEQGEPALLPLGHQQPRAVHVRRRRGDPRGARAGGAGAGGGAGTRRAAGGVPARTPLRARSATRPGARARVRVRRPRRRRRRPPRGRAARAHAGRGADDPRERVRGRAARLAQAPRALYRVHEPPEPQSVELLLSRLAELEVPTPPSPTRRRWLRARRRRSQPRPASS